MPIYDFNGTTKQEIGKIYDFNGTANSQIGKVYDNNGSTNSLIYTGEESLLGGFTLSTASYCNRDAAMTQTDDSLYVSAKTIAGSSGGGASVYTAQLDVSSFSQILVNVTEFINASYIPFCRFGLSPNLSTAESNKVWPGQGNVATLGMTLGYTEIRGTGVYTCAIPPGTTAAIIILAFVTTYQGGSSGSRHHITLDKFALE